MRLPIVTELPLRLEPVLPDPFITAIEAGDPGMSPRAAPADAMRAEASIAGAQPSSAHAARRRRLIADPQAADACVPAPVGIWSRRVGRGPDACATAGDSRASPPASELPHVLALS